MQFIKISRLDLYSKLTSQGHAFLNYLLKRDYEDLSKDEWSFVDRIRDIAFAEHPSILVCVDGADIIIVIPDEIYTLTQIKYANYINT